VFDVGFWELAIIAVIALLVIGPERLPKAARTAGLWVGRARRMVTDVKADIDREIREGDLAELKKAGEELKKTQSAVESAGAEIIEDSELGELKKTGEELKAAKGEFETVGEELKTAKSEAESFGTNLADSDSMNSVGESIESGTPTPPADPNENNTSR
jgi:sec-independent protein translocase protein TatB